MNNRANGWKEIALHMNRSVRCVQRWERHESLPVRRHGHARGASVYAFADELDAWWQNELHGSTGSPIKESSIAVKREHAVKSAATRGGPTEFGLTAEEAASLIFILRQLETEYRATRSAKKFGKLDKNLWAATAT